MSARLGTFFVSVLIFSVACGTAGPGGSGLNANLITRQQIDEEGASNAYIIAQALRPTWLQKRGATSFYNEGEIRVYLDNQSLGGLESLREIHSDNIESIQSLEERRASLRYGPGHEHGVILITTRR